MVVAKGPHVVRRGVVSIVVGIRVQQPDTGEAAGADPVVEVVERQVGVVIINVEALPSLVGVLVAVGELVHKPRVLLEQPGRSVGGSMGQLPRQGRGGQAQHQRKCFHVEEGCQETA